MLTQLSILKKFITGNIKNNVDCLLSKIFQFECYALSRVNLYFFFVNI